MQHFLYSLHKNRLLNSDAAIATVQVDRHMLEANVKLFMLSLVYDI